MYTLDGKEITYSIEENGYTIYSNGNPWIDQHEPYIPIKSLSYEENAIAQIEDMLQAQKEEKKLEEQVSELKEEVALQNDYSMELLYKVCLLELGINESDLEGGEIDGI